MSELSIKGFVTNRDKWSNEIVNNTGVVATFGELSADSKTFAKEVGMYGRSNSPLGIATFHCRDGSTKVPLPNAQRSIIEAVIDWVYAQARRPVLLTPNEYIYSFNLEFNNRQITDIEFGELETDGTDTLPWFVAFTYNGVDYIKMWFGDQWFADQYDEHEIVVCPALANVDDFWLPASVVKQKLELNDLVEHSRRVQELRGGFPPTSVETEMFLYYDPQNLLNTAKTYWTLLGYGPDSTNIDYRKDALVDYILSNSTHSREEWMTILPDLFKRSEFYIMPQWDLIAIETTQTNDRGVYSAISNLRLSMSRLKAIAADYDPAHVGYFAETWPHHYKPLSIYSIANVETKGRKYSLFEWYKDYIPVKSSTSLEWNFMEPNTQEWASLIAELLYLAEIHTKYRRIPRKYSKVVRNGFTFIVGSHKGLKFLVYARMNNF